MSTIGIPLGQRRQQPGLVCVAFCSGPMSAFVEAAIEATAKICTAPLWGNAECMGTVGATATKYRATSPEKLLADLASWLRCNRLAERNLFAFELCEGVAPFDAERRIEVVADVDATGSLSTVRHLFELHLPAAAMAPPSVPENFGRLMQVLLTLPFESCYASPAISWSKHPAFGRADVSHSAPAFRNPALDVHDNVATRFLIGRRCRGAKWFTLLKADLAARIDGQAVANRLQSEGLTASTQRGTLAVQVSPDPFDMATRGTEALRRYRALAHELEDITLFDDIALQQARFVQNPELLDRYERRFLE